MSCGELLGPALLLIYSGSRTMTLVRAAMAFWRSGCLRLGVAAPEDCADARKRLCRGPRQPLEVREPFAAFRPAIAATRGLWSNIIMILVLDSLGIPCSLLLLLLYYYYYYCYYYYPKLSLNHYYYISIIVIV